MMKQFQLQKVWFHYAAETKKTSSVYESSVFIQITERKKVTKHLLTTIAPSLSNNEYEVPARATCREIFGTILVTCIGFLSKIKKMLRHNLEGIIRAVMEKLGNASCIYCKRWPEWNSGSRKINKHEIRNYGHYLRKIY